jgi:hypothetical protein
MIIRRRHNGHFTIVPNKVFIEDRLSLEAKGLLGYLLSRPHGWHVHLEVVAKTQRIGRKKAQRLFNELIDARYISRHDQPRLAGQRFGRVDYIVYDVPVARPTRPHRRLNSNRRPPWGQTRPAVKQGKTVSCTGTNPELGADSPRAQKGPAYKDGESKPRGYSRKQAVRPQLRDAASSDRCISADQRRRQDCERALVERLGGWEAAAEFGAAAFDELIERKLDGTLRPEHVTELIARRPLMSRDRPGSESSNVIMEPNGSGGLERDELDTWGIPEGRRR